MHTVLILKGLPASGKSTWAKEKVASSQVAWKRVNKDDLRAMVDNGVYSKGNESFVLKLRDNLILSALDEGCNVIVDDTNLNPTHEEHIRMIVEGYCNSRNLTIEVQIKEFNTDLETCIERDKARPNPVGQEVIKKMARQWLRINTTQTPNPVLDKNKENAIICDIDGTLALIGDRSPYDCTDCHVKDDINKSVLYVLNHICEDVDIILLTGRDAELRESTEKFLDKHNVPYDFLWMRNNGDRRKDSIVKKELYYQHVHNQYNTLFWIDDRDQVVKMVRHELKIPCFQVNDGDF